MRHPLLRILVAVFIGVVSPLCCCRAMALAGSACGGRHVPAAAAESCCEGCSDEPASDHDPETPADEDAPSPGKCPSCPSCEGTPVGTGVKAEVRVPAFDTQWNALATISLAGLWNLPPVDSQAAAFMHGGAVDPPFLKANRDALRWHCALVV